MSFLSRIFKREPNTTVTLSQYENLRDLVLEINTLFKEHKTRFETLYRAYYRGKAKENNEETGDTTPAIDSVEAWLQQAKTGDRVPPEILMQIKGR